jgi:flagellar hook-associated protein 2
VTTTGAISSAINVQAIVSDLMEVERRPITKLENQIADKELVVSALGAFKSKVAVLESAVKAIQTPSVFSQKSTSSTDATKVSATATNAASTGSYTVKVAQTALAATYSMSGFTAGNQVMDLTSFSLVAGGKTFEPRFAKVTGASSFSAGDSIRMTLTGGQQQTFNVTSQKTAAEVASGINLAVISGSLSGVSASVATDGKLLITSSNPIQGVSVEVKTPGYQDLGSAQTYQAGDQIKFAAGSAPVQSFTLTTQTTASQVADAINVAVGAGTLSGVRASVVDNKLRISATNVALGVTGLNHQRGATVTNGEAAVPAGTPSVDNTTQEGLIKSGTVTDLKNWVNALKTDAQASLVQIGPNDLTFSVTAKKTGTSNDIVVAGVKSAASQVDTVTLGGAYLAGDSLSLTVNGVALPAYTVTANNLTVNNDGTGGAASEAQIRANIASSMSAAFNSSLNPAHTSVTATASSGVITLTADVAGTAFTTSVSETSASGTAVQANVTANVPPVNFTVSQTQAARDAVLSVNGIGVIRASNQVSDIVDGVTFNLNAATVPTGGPITSISPTTFSDANVITSSVTVSAGAEDLSGEAMRDLANAYNGLMTFYFEQSKASATSSERGLLNSDGTLRSFVDRFRSMFGLGIRLQDGSSLSLGSAGLELQRDGTLVVNEAKLSSAVAGGLQSKLSEGVTIGYESATSNLAGFLTQSLSSKGMVSLRIAEVETQQNTLTDRKLSLETDLALTQERYLRKYAALDALLTRLQVVSNGLATAIDSLINSQKN